MQINSSIQAASPQFGWNPLKSIVTPLILLTGLASCSPKLNPDIYQPIHGQMTTMADLLTKREQAELQATFDRYDSSDPQDFQINNPKHQERAQQFFKQLATVADTAYQRLLRAEGRSEADLKDLKSAADVAGHFTTGAYDQPEAAVANHRNFDMSEQNDKCHIGGTVMQVIGLLLGNTPPRKLIP